MVNKPIKYYIEYIHPLVKPEISRVTKNFKTLRGGKWFLGKFRKSERYLPIEGYNVY